MLASNTFGHPVLFLTHMQRLFFWTPCFSKNYKFERPISKSLLRLGIDLLLFIHLYTCIIKLYVVLFPQKVGSNVIKNKFVMILWGSEYEGQHDWLVIHWEMFSNPRVQVDENMSCINVKISTNYVISSSSEWAKHVPVLSFPTPRLCLVRSFLNPVNSITMQWPIQPSNLKNGYTTPNP